MEQAIGVRKGTTDDITRSWAKTTPRIIPLKTNAPTPQAVGFIDGNAFGGYNRVYSINYDGEKDLGEIGPIRKYILDHTALRLRSWQLFLESDVCQALFSRSATWGIGSGLKLQCEPQIEVLKGEGITVDAETFNDPVEARFKIFASSTMCDYAGNRTLHDIASEGWINKDVGGDVLAVLRLINGVPKVQLIDGSHLRTPLTGDTNTGMDILNPDNKNRIRQGIEIDDKGHHVAYWVYKGILSETIGDYERIEAKMSKYPYSEMTRLIYGLKYRLDNVRGIPMISAVMETAAKMGRYREATLGSAEEKAKIPYTIEHGKLSTNENPVLNQMAGASGFGPQTDLPMDSIGNNLADRVAASTNKMVFNMPNDSKMTTPFDGKQELYFTEFYTTNFDIVCAVAGYPPEVIMSKYNSNYSASRAAIKDFEHTLDIKREKFAQQFYQLIYNFCLDIWALSGIIEAPGYLNALASQNEMALAAYRNARWVGDKVPHIDPYKEAQAIRALLPEDSANFPLITLEQAVEIFGGGDYDAILEQYAKERDKGNKLKIEMVLPKGAGLEGTQPNGNPAKKKASASLIDAIGDHMETLAGKELINFVDQLHSI